MTSALYAEYTARLADLKAKREKLSTALDAALENSEIESYQFSDSTDQNGQSVRRRDPAKTMKLLEDIDRQILRYETLLSSGSGVRVLNMRRTT